MHVGSRIRLRRKTLGVSQEKLGAALGLTFQQVQKYERGANRVGASRLYALGRVLDVPVAFFFDDVDPVRAPGILRDFDAAASANDPLSSPETRDLVEAYYDITDARIRRALFELAKALVARLPSDGQDG